LGRDVLRTLDPAPFGRRFKKRDWALSINFTDAHLKKRTMAARKKGGSHVAWDARALSSS
jgi:hypothetical protein